jgi:hypothetical protein
MLHVNIECFQYILKCVLSFRVVVRQQIAVGGEGPDWSASDRKGFCRLSLFPGICIIRAS